MRRRSIWLGMAAFTANVALAFAALPTSLEVLGETALPGDARADGTPVGGLSGLAFDARTGRFLALSDDRSELAPARFFRLAIDLVEGKPVVRVEGATTLTTGDGRPFPSRSLDPEGIALGEDRIFVASEGEARVGQAPFVAEFDLAGRLRRELPLPTRYLPVVGASVGVRDNLAFEALALTPDGRYLFAGLENGLAQESPAAAPGVPSLSRLLRWDLQLGGAAEEFLYRVEAVTVTPPTPSDLDMNGLVEAIALDRDHLLTLERQWVPSVGVEIRLFEVALAGAAEVSHVDPPGSLALAVAAKTLLLDFADLGLPLDNFEGMTFGPALPDGRRTLFMVSDDNFNPEIQKTLVLAFAVGFEPLAIAAVQGAGQRSPLVGRWVAGVEGVVTATEDRARRKGFWMESTAPDADPATSEGVYAAWEGASTLHAGERVRVGGRVEERAANEASLPVTTLRVVALAKVEAGLHDPPLPAPARLIEGLHIPPRIDDKGFAKFAPASDAIDFWESLESMRITVPAGTVVGATRSFGDFVLLPDGAALRGAQRTLAGGLAIADGADLPERVIVGRRLAGRMPDFQVGDRIGAPLTGIVDYGFANYRLQTFAPPAAQRGARPCGERTALAGDAQHLTAATFNLENFSIANAGSRIDEVGRALVHALGAPAIVALQEVQDDSGPADDGVVTAQATLAALADAVVAAGGPRYEPVVIDPENDRDGGQPGGNIRVVLLFDPARVQLVHRGEARANDPADIVGRGRTTALALSPARLAPHSSAFDLRQGEGVRKSLTAEFRAAGRTLFVIANHWTSKWDDDRAFGARQPPQTGVTAERRLAQARVVRGFVDRLLGAEPGARVVVLGDLNEPDSAPGVTALTAPPLVELGKSVAANDRYSYNFEGNSELIDHIVVSPALATGAEVDIVHLDSNCPDSERLSDHDPVVARLPID